MWSRDEMTPLLGQGVVLQPESQVEAGGEAAQPKEVGRSDFLFAESSPPNHFF